MTATACPHEATSSALAAEWLPSHAPSSEQDPFMDAMDYVPNEFDLCRHFISGSYLSNFLQNALKSSQLEINPESRGLRPLVKSKEPKDQYLLPKELDCPLQAARWPTECQVCEERVEHIDYTPQQPEAYYQVTGREVQPKPVGEDAGNIVFQYYPMSAVNYFSRSSIGGSRYFMPAIPSDRELEDELRFESRFESGNLAKVVKITDTYYELYLRTDMYTNRHMQWFYFKVSNTKANTTYRFSLVNLSKGDSLYSMGMKPLMYSTKDAKLNSIGWRRFGDNIAYYKNEPANGEEDQAVNYTLTFNVEFRYDKDEVYISHCYPYTYTDLQDYLNKLQNHPAKLPFTKLRLLCRTLAGNNVYYLTITEPSISDDPQRKKKAVVITARVHPGETPSSWMMKGFIDFLTGDSAQAKELREKFIFKLVPMLNPDGVIVGNNRCSLTGRDLNRQYRTVIRETYPPVWHTKLMIRRLMEECGIVMYCDLHAHSRKHNVFIYGCENKRYVEKRLQEQVFPLMLHKNAADKFSFENCKFRIQRSKEGTGRVVVWMMGVANSYTMEASFAGSTLGSKIDTHFTVQDFETMGRSFCETLLDFCDEEPSKEKLRTKIIERLVKEGSSADEPTNITLSDYSSDEGDTSLSSAEDPVLDQGGNMSWLNREAEYCRRLTVPPPSPQAPKETRRTAGSPQKKAHFGQEKSPPPPREPLQVHTTTIDPPTLDSSDDSGDESTSFNILQACQDIHSKPEVRYRRGRKKHMPPELIVTAAHRSSPELKSRLQKERKPRSKSWHPSRTQNLEMSAENATLGGTLRRKIWTGCPCNAVHSDNALSHAHISKKAHWSKAVPTVETSDTLLRSCSKKLIALQNVTNTTSSGNEENRGKVKKRKLWPKKKTSKSKLEEQVDKACASDKAQQNKRGSRGSMGNLVNCVRSDLESQHPRSTKSISSRDVQGSSQSSLQKKQSKFKAGSVVAGVVASYTKQIQESGSEAEPGEKTLKKKKKRKGRMTKKGKHSKLPSIDNPT